MKDDFVDRVYSGRYNNAPSRFKADLLSHLGVTGHPKADRLYALAYEYGHAHGYSEVLHFANGLVGLLNEEGSNE